MVLYSFIKGIFKEALAKKVLLTIFGFFSLIIVLFVFGVTNSTVEGLQMMLESGSEGSYKDAIILFESYIVSGIPMFMIIISILIITSSFVPDMVKKGHIDLLLSKPISRIKIILGHFISATILAFVSFVFLLGIVWLIISLKTGYWHFDFLYSILWFTVIFAVLYSAILLIGLLTRSTIITIIINLFMFFPITYLLYLGNRYFESDQKNIVFGAATEIIIKFFYQILPKAWNIQDICESFVTRTPVANYQPLISSLIFMGVMLSISLWYFNRKDY